ncbi:MAG: DUF3365 domain-containing protein [Chromatiales bacterium]|jgi:hypothetical protein
MTRTAALFAALLAGTGPVLAGEVNVDERVQASRTAVKDFFGDLKGRLQAAIAEGGPVNAIEVCSIQAPQIAARVSRETGWDVGRTSLKTRNPANRPDTWEKSVLEDFEARKAAGEDPGQMEYYAVVDGDRGKAFRYMKAIPTAEKPCLACHGSAIAPEVAARLDALYPTDEARGYQAGDIRGAFTITQPLD